jgi:hypothetical protein
MPAGVDGAPADPDGIAGGVFASDEGIMPAGGVVVVGVGLPTAGAVGG